MLSNETRIEEFIDKFQPGIVPKAIKMLPFGAVPWSWMPLAREKLKNKVGNNLSLLTAKSRFDLERSLVLRWSLLCAPTFQFLLDYALSDLSLRGSTPKQRYKNFIQDTFFNSAALKNFFNEYKVLADQIANYLDFWVEQVDELLGRFKNDRPLLENTFGQLLAKIIGINMSAGDAHHRGRSVAILKFKSGISLVYKPKNINGAAIFHSLLDWINTQNLGLHLQSYKILPRGNYGWEELVMHRSCQNSQQVDSYFKRSGMYLCLMYLLGGTDLHYENVIANGEHPMFIDLEALFFTNVSSSRKESVDDFMQHSVLFTGLLPGAIMRKGIEKGFDVMGLSNHDAAIRRIQKWVNLESDAIHLDHFDADPKIMANHVIHENKICSARDYIEQIVSGFRLTYNHIQKNKMAFSYYLNTFRNEPVRVILRSTRAYAQVLERLFEPHQILNRDLFFKKLDSLNLPYKKMDFPPLIIEAEKRSLLQGDIPCFYTFPSSRNLYSNQELIAENCLDGVSLDREVAKLMKMGESDRNLQESFIRQSFEIKETPVHEMFFQGIIGVKTPTENEILVASIKIADQIKNKAFKSDDGSWGWIGLEPNLATEENHLVPLGESLFSGRMGIALFFAALARISGDQQWRDATLNTLMPLRRSIKSGVDLISIIGIGGMTGLGGLIYGLFHIGKLLDSPNLIDDAHALVNLIENQHIEEDDHYDVVFGTAGLALSLMSFHKNFPHPKLDALANKCGAHLCKHATFMNEDSESWKTSYGKPFLGMSHGNAGIVYALQKINQSLYLPTIKKGLAFERKHYCNANKNWPHLGTNTFLCSWCHGATGIGLARLFSTGNDSEYEKEIEVAIQSTIQHLDQGGITLCCSLLGRLEFLREASKTMPNLSGSIERAIRNIYAQIESPFSEVYRPSFMQGQAGLGYTLLRLIDKNEVLPQVLLLD